MRQSLEQELAVSAKTGDTARLITALEEGAPFVVGMVSSIGWHFVTLRQKALIQSEHTRHISISYN